MSAHGFSKSAREKIESAGGTVTWLRGDPDEKKRKKRKKRSAKNAAPPKPPAAEQDAAVDIVEPTATDVSEEGESE